MRSSAVALVVVLVGAVGVLGAVAIRGQIPRRHAQKAAAAPAKKPAVVVANAAPLVVQAAVPVPVVQEPSVVTHPKAPFVPVVPQGESSLPEGPTASRADSLVTVSFDMPMIRTRIPAKFERLVRSTLPSVYGQSIDSVLSKIPEGGIARQGDLIAELPTRGVRIPVNDDWTIALYPETRPGHDGPLVVRYRVSVVTKTN